MSQNKFKNIYKIYEEEAIDDFERWERNNIKLKDYMNILYVISIQENINDYENLLYIFENLVINNEILNSNTINYYNLETLKNKFNLTNNEIKAIKENKVIIAVNWYNAKHILKYGKIRVSTEMNIIKQIEEANKNELLH